MLIVQSFIVKVVMRIYSRPGWLSETSCLTAGVIVILQFRQPASTARGLRNCGGGTRPLVAVKVVYVMNRMMLCVID